MAIEAVLYRLDTPELGAALTNAISSNEALAGWRDQLGHDEHQLEMLATDFGNGAITAASGSQPETRSRPGSIRVSLFIHLEKRQPVAR